MNHVVILYLAAALMDFSVAGLSFAISRRAAELGATAFALGLLGAVAFGAYTVFALLSGRLSDRHGRRQVALAGVLASAAVTLVCGFVTNVPWLVALSVLLGAGWGSFWPPLIAWLGEGASGAALATRIARFSIAWNFGILSGFGLIGFIFAHGPRLAFYVTAGVMLVVAALLLLAERYTPRQPPAEAGADLAPLLPPVPKGRGFRKTAWLCNFAVNFSMAGATALFPQLATHLGIPADHHGLLLALGRAAALVTFWLLQHLMFWRTRLWPLWVAQAVCATGLALFGFADASWVFAIGLAAGGMVAGYSYQASIFFTLEEVAEKGKGSGFHEAVLGSGMFLGPILAGAVGNHWSLRAPYYFCAAALLVLIAVQMLLVWGRRHHALTAT